MEIVNEMKKCFRVRTCLIFQCSLKVLAQIKTFWQHYLESKEPTFLACISEQVYPAIFETCLHEYYFDFTQKNIYLP